MVDQHPATPFDTEAGLADVRKAFMQGMKSSDTDWSSFALALFRWQFAHNEVYAEFVHHLGIDPHDVRSPEEIPCLPVEAFKHHQVKSTSWEVAKTFRSSGTSGVVSRSQHCLDDQGWEWYHHVTAASWKHVWCTPASEHQWLGLLPGYLGREDASLLAMVEEFMHQSGHPPRMFMRDHEAISSGLEQWIQEGCQKRMVLVGVTWAILDWLDAGLLPEALNNAEVAGKFVLLETGGMKGRGVEPIRQEVHEAIHRRLPGIQIASEYGMTEMMSQAYALDGIHQKFPPWVLPVVRDARDPMVQLATGRTGRLDVMDLANIHSCAFLATSDLAQHHREGLQILGRVDRSEVRGCSLLASE